MSSQIAQRHLGTTRRTQESAGEKLASGSRINRAGDDAAGLAISEKLKALTRSLRQDYRNANDGISLIQTAEGAMNEAGNILIRLRELSIQASSDTIGDNERGYLDMEVQQLTQELRRISHSTEYNGTKLLSDEPGILDIQVGAGNDGNDDRLYFDVLSASVSPERLRLGSIDVRTKSGAQENLSKIDAAISNLNRGRANLGALQNRLQSTMNHLQNYDENVQGANSRLRDTDVAEQTAELTRANILANSGLAVLAQANQSGALALKLLG